MPNAAIFNRRRFWDPILHLENGDFRDFYMHSGRCGKFRLSICHESHSLPPFANYLAQEKESQLRPLTECILPLLMDMLCDSVTSAKTRNH